MSPITSLLIANRGEIACRIIASARRMGIRTIAVYSQADKDSRHVAMADEAYFIGPAAASESYLVAQNILDVAKQSGAQAIHPGYGFLSERASFADACAHADIVFVGPPGSAIRAMGLKGEAKALMQKARVPVVPGYHGERQEPDFLREKAYEIGYPVLIKAVAGGGGKGMRRVDRALDFDEALQSAGREAQSAFGDGRVLIEKYIVSPRHIEIQVFADSHGNVVHLFERDCSLQRRHQKVIEEAPAPGLSQAMREAMGQAAVNAAKAVSYVGAGTVEFIVDASKGLKSDGFYFMEMNTRLQVEHPVTEAITGLDLVELQLKIAGGERLPFAQADLAINGHAVEARLYAEDPHSGFLPSTGKIEYLSFPPAAEAQIADDGLRIDTGVRSGDMVTPYYDPMLAKIIVHAATREDALTRLADALAQVKIAGPRTNAVFLKNLVLHPDFRAEKFDTGFIDAHLPQLLKREINPHAAQSGLSALLAQEQGIAVAARRSLAKQGWRSPWDNADRFSMSDNIDMSYAVDVDGEVQTLKPAAVNEIQTVMTGQGVFVLDGDVSLVQWPDVQKRLSNMPAGNGTLSAPMNGKVTIIHAKEGDEVKAGDRILVIEAMKMEHVVTATQNGKLAAIYVAAGDQVERGASVAQIEIPKTAAA